MKRRAFTLIELLIVIAIIGVLLGLVVAYLSGMMGKGRDVKTAVEIGAMEAALKKFHADHGFYPPSQFKICRNITKIDTASVRYWQKMYPNMVMINPMNNNRPVPNSDWAPFVNGLPGVDANMVPLQPGPPNSPTDGQPIVPLTSDQCLVFFLSGFQGRGLSPNPRNPTDFSNGLTGKKYFDFESSRLFDIKVYGVSFPGYIDPYGIRYAYLSGEGQPSQSWTSDDSRVQPYYQMLGANRDYFKKFQIISAGADNQFGPGGLYNPANPTATNGGWGFDDIANFREKKLGIQ